MSIEITCINCIEGIKKRDRCEMVPEIDVLDIAHVGTPLSDTLTFIITGPSKPTQLVQWSRLARPIVCGMSEQFLYWDTMSR